MMRSEFNEMVGYDVSVEDYEKVEMVYLYYPGIEDKQQMCTLYNIGMHIICDMLPRATELAAVEMQIRDLNKRKNELNGENQCYTVL